MQTSTGRADTLPWGPEDRLPRVGEQLSRGGAREPGGEAGWSQNGRGRARGASQDCGRPEWDGRAVRVLPSRTPGLPAGHRHLLLSRAPVLSGKWPAARCSHSKSSSSPTRSRNVFRPGREVVLTKRESEVTSDVSTHKVTDPPSVGQGGLYWASMSSPISIFESDTIILKMSSVCLLDAIWGISE